MHDKSLGLKTNKPNLFIVGAAKSGTTTLYSYLEKHSEVFMPEDELYKEPAFFSVKGEKMSTERYWDIFKNATQKHKYIGDASTAYLTDITSAKKIFDYNKNSKIIIILRNPVHRAYSLYNWMVQDGYEYSKDFQSAIEKEKFRKNKEIPNFFEPEYYWNYMYYSSGLYYKQVERYFKLFKQENILVLIFEDMVKDIENTYKEVSKFLDIEFENISAKQENESRKVYCPLCSFIGRKFNNYFNRVQNKFINVNKKEKRDWLIYKLQKNEKPNKLDKTTANSLLKLYINDIEKLEEFLNINLSNWK